VEWPRRGTVCKFERRRRVVRRDARQAAAIPCSKWQSLRVVGHSKCPRWGARSGRATSHLPHLRAALEPRSSRAARRKESTSSQALSFSVLWHQVLVGRKGCFRWVSHGCLDRSIMRMAVIQRESARIFFSDPFRKRKAHTGAYTIPCLSDTHENHISCGNVCFSSVPPNTSHTQYVLLGFSRFQVTLQSHATPTSTGM
jgi:hypothetical protein